jgi:hypothetical protein
MAYQISLDSIPSKVEGRLLEKLGLDDTLLKPKKKTKGRGLANRLVS